ncbi:MAG: alpha/beta hydrolase family protein [Actinomycetales bacterium]
MSQERSRRRRAASYAAVVGGGLVGLAAVSATGLATYFTRRVVTPLVVKPDDLEIYDVGPDRVVLSSTPDTRVPGRYGLWLDGGRGHARIGAIIGDDGATVTRELERVDYGELTPGPARFNQYYVAGDPTVAWDIAHEDVLVPSEVGDLPTWLVRPGSGTPYSDVWAVLVHGRGATREECLRAVPVLHRLGMGMLVPAYRNDRDAPDGQVGRYHFGGIEWRDIESAVVWAINNGARRIVLFGWSMGGAITLQLVSRSWVADRVDAVVLDAPVVDWGDVLAHTARVNRVPSPVGRISHGMVRNPLLRKVVGLGEPVDLRTLNWVRRARELSVPILLVHSEADEVVPVGPSRALAAARPDVVTFAPWSTARHTKEWNVDPEVWDGVVESFLVRHLQTVDGVKGRP